MKAPEIVYQRTISPMEAPDKVTTITIGFKKGDAVSLNGKAQSPATLLKALNDLGRDNGIGRLDLVENRFVGMKSRGVYETPGGTILLAAHRAMESITLDRGAAHLKDEIDAALCRADLQRLLVLARARDAASVDRQIAGACRRRSHARALQGQRHRRWPREQEERSIRRRSSPSKTTRAPTIRRTRRASSS